jgi:hypothetical protein
MGCGETESSGNQCLQPVSSLLDTPAALSVHYQR